MCGTIKPGQKPMAGEVIGPIGEKATAVVLINGHVLKLPSIFALIDQWCSRPWSKRLLCAVGNGSCRDSQLLNSAWGKVSRVFSSKWDNSVSLPKSHGGRGGRKNVELEDGEGCYEVSSDMKWPLYSWTHRSYGYLHKTCARISQPMSMSWEEGS